MAEIQNFYYSVLMIGIWDLLGIWILGFGISESRILKGMREMTDQWEPKILAFLCNWCSYAGADLAGTSRVQYPPNIRVIRVPCSGRINPLFILKALQSGIDGVLVSGCHPGDCHYISGNYVGRRKSATLKRFLEYLGFEEGRVQFSWVSAAEGVKFSQVVGEVVQDIKKLGPTKRFVKKGFEFRVNSSERKS
jgi:F420-non-reducing hydrogenase iron-sulfur subunit